MVVKILEKFCQCLASWQVGQWPLLCSHRTGAVGSRATPASPHHLANTFGYCLEVSLSRVSGCFCLYIHPHLCSGCQEERSSVAGGWVCAGVSSCFAPAPAHPTTTAASITGTHRLESKKLPSLLPTWWAIRTNLFLTTCFILVKDLRHLVIVNLSHNFINFTGVGRKSKPIWDGPQQTLHFGSSGKSKYCSLFPLSTRSLKPKAGNDYATQPISSW